MSKYKVCVYAIAKNDEKNIDTWYDSMKEADCVIVADTGSTDKTIEKLIDLGVYVYSIYVNPFRYDKARNLSMAFIPDDVDICVCTDLDEIFEPGWRALLEAAWQENTTRLRCQYSSCKKLDVSMKNERIHTRQYFSWLYPIHETLKYFGDGDDICVTETKIHLKTNPEATETERNKLEMLEMSEKEYPLYEHNIYTLGYTYFLQANYDKAIRILGNYLSLPTATWTVKRSAAMRFIASCYQAQDNIKEAMVWLFRSVAEGITIREPFLSLAKIGYNQRNWIMTYYMVDTALAITERTNTYLDEEEAWGSILYDLGSNACYHLGLYKQAYLYAADAVTYDPDNPCLLDNLSLTEATYNAYLLMQKSEEFEDY